MVGSEGSASRCFVGRHGRLPSERLEGSASLLHGQNFAKGSTDAQKEDVKENTNEFQGTRRTPTRRVESLA